MGHIASCLIQPKSFRGLDIYQFIHSACKMANQTLATQLEARNNSVDNEVVRKASCSTNFRDDFTNSCDNSWMVFRPLSFIIIILGLSLNVVTLLAFKSIKLNAASLFLMKCLSVYDSLFLWGALLSHVVHYLAWILGFGYINATPYLYVDRISYYCLQRIAAPMSYWTAAVITVQR